MNFLLPYIIYLVAIFSCGNNRNQDQLFVDNDTTFINWNKATLHSLSRQIELAKDSVERKMYENRMQAFKAFVDIDDGGYINPNSIRYKFIKRILESEPFKKNFYIVEANRSGEKVEIRNYVIFSNSTGKSDVDVYNYINRNWVKNPVSKKIEFLDIDSLASYLTKFRLGFNQDDIIITRFVDIKVIDSEYYLYTTLTDSNNFRELLFLR